MDIFNQAVMNLHYSSEKKERATENNKTKPGSP